MKKREMKKAYKKYAKENKTSGYRFCLIGAIVASIGALMVAPVVILSMQNKIDLVTHITYIVPGVIVAIAGGVIDGIGEIYKAKELKEFSKTNNKEQSL